MREWGEKKKKKKGKRGEGEWPRMDDAGRVPPYITPSPSKGKEGKRGRATNRLHAHSQTNILRIPSNSAPKDARKGGRRKKKRGEKASPVVSSLFFKQGNRGGWY